VNTLTLRSELPPSTPAGLELVERIGQRIRAGEQVPIATHHVLHAGVYSRTICIPAGVALEGALIKIPTTLIICGRAVVLLGDGEEVLVEGYQVLAASGGRKQAYRAHADTWITMSFRTQATTVEQAEAEFTDQADQLMSRTGENVVVITGD
jgi:hypothetical protein